ncbi:MAG: trypsin-like peptidase domain-containing protein [bacterium]
MENLKRTYELTFIFLVLFLAPGFAQVSLPELVRRIKPAVVTVLTFDRYHGLLAQGSGFLVSNDRVITSRHVLVQAFGGKVKLNDRTECAIRGVLAEDTARDLILLQIDPVLESIAPLELFDGLPQEGERVLVVGSPMGFGQSLSDGIVAAIRKINTVGQIIQITAPISSGSSGSPVVNMDGQVVGIATVQILQGQNLNFAIPGEYARHLHPHKFVHLEEWHLESAGAPPALSQQFFNQGLQWVKAKNYARALHYFNIAVAQDTHRAEAWFYVGYCKGQLGHFKEAIKASQNALQINPSLAQAYYNLGVAYMSLGLLQKALEAYQLAIRFKPDYVNARLHLGYAYLAIGNKGGAVAQYKILKFLSPELANFLHHQISRCHEVLF